MSQSETNLLGIYATKIEKAFQGLSNEVDLILKQNLKERQVSKNEYLLNASEISKSIYIVHSGSFWKFYSHKGKKIPSEFIFQNEIIFSFSSYLAQAPSREYIQALESSLVYYFDYGIFESLRADYSELQAIDTLFLEYQILKLEDRISSIQFNNAEEKLNWLQTREPHLLEKVSKRHLASYLGITLETFIRLQKKV
jgi:CRP-like cAMP-binding protein